MEIITKFFTGGDFWEVLVKVLATTLLSTGIGFIGTLIGRAISKNKESKIYKYAKTCVAAAEMKFPNEGRKMGPEKMAYVMDQMAIKFPKIKESTYFYNIAEAAVLELNRKMKEEVAIKEFEEKYGEKPLAALEKEMVEEETPKNELKEELLDSDIKSSNVKEEVAREEIKLEVEETPKNKATSKIRSF